MKFVYTMETEPNQFVMEVGIEQNELQKQLVKSAYESGCLWSEFLQEWAGDGNSMFLNHTFKKKPIWPHRLNLIMQSLKYLKSQWTERAAMFKLLLMMSIKDL